MDVFTGPFQTQKMEKEKKDFALFYWQEAIENGEFICLSKKRERKRIFELFNRRDATERFFSSLEQKTTADDDDDELIELFSHR